MKEPRLAHMVRVYDEAMFARLRVRAAEEGRTVGAVVENALRLYLGVSPSTVRVYGQGQDGTSDAGFGPPASLRGAKPDGPLPRVPPQPTVEGLRELIRSVPVSRATEPVEKRVETLREKLEREAAAREWLRSHPEEEGQ